MIALLILAVWVQVPYPILLVLGGVALGLAPGVPDVELSSSCPGSPAGAERARSYGWI